MDSFLPQTVDRMLRRYPVLMVCCLLLCFLIGCAALISAGHDLLVYEGF